MEFLAKLDMWDYLAGLLLLFVHLVTVRWY